MDVDLDTFLTEVYVAVDTWCVQHPLPPRRGPRERLSRSEVLTLELVGHWRGTSERGLLAYAATYLRPWFPRLLSPSAFNRRARQLTDQVIALMHDLALQLRIWEDAYEIVDGLPVPLAQRVRGQCRACFPDTAATVGRGGPGKVFFYGVSVLLSVSASGVITGFVMAPANMAERWLLEALLTWRADPSAVPLDGGALPAPGHGRSRLGPDGERIGPATAGVRLHDVYLADQGFAGAAWREGLGATVWTHDQLPGELRHWFHHARQTVETVIAQLTETLHIKFPRARTVWGLLTRIAAKCAALNLGILLNRRYHRPDLALGTLFRA
jgi:hypothetical protein